MVYSKSLILVCGASFVAAANDAYRRSGSAGSLKLVTSSAALGTSDAVLQEVTDYVGQGTGLGNDDSLGIFLQYESGTSSDTVVGTDPSAGDANSRLAIKIEGIHVADSDSSKTTAANMWYDKAGTNYFVDFDDTIGNDSQYASNTLTQTMEPAASTSQNLSDLAKKITVLVAPGSASSWYYQCGMKMSWAFMESPVANTAVGVLTDSSSQAAEFVCSCAIQGNVTLLDAKPSENVHFATLNISDCTNSLLKKIITIEFAQGATTKDDVDDASLILNRFSDEFEVKGHPSEKVSNSNSNMSGAKYKNLAFDISGSTWSQSTTLELYTKAGGFSDVYKQDADVVYMRMLSSHQQLGSLAVFDATNSPNFLQDGDSWREIGVGVNSGALQSMSIFSAFLAVAGSFLI